MSATDKHTLAFGIPAQGFPIGSVDARMIGVMRCILAVSALAIINLDPEDSRRFLALTSASVFVYLVWSAVSLAMATRRLPLRPPRHEHWVDVFFSAFVVGLTVWCSACRHDRAVLFGGDLGDGGAGGGGVDDGFVRRVGGDEGL